MHLVLETHPDVFCYGESNGYAVLQKSFPEDLPRARLIGLKLPRWTAQLTCQALFDEGLERAAVTISTVVKRILFLHRVRDTIASMLKSKVRESNWCEVWVHRIIDSKLARDETFFALLPPGSTGSSLTETLKIVLP